jgi:lipoprotein NlpI
MAKYHYDNAIEADMKNTSFLMNRAQCFYDQTMFDLSIEDLTKADQYKPNDPLILYKLGLSEYASENYK